MLYLFLTFSLFLGLVIGSFINAFVWRLHEKKSLWERSICPKCKTAIKWYDNLPLLSFLILKGRCRSCGKRISIQYPLVEIVVAVLFLAVTYAHLSDWLNVGFLSVVDNRIVYLAILRDLFLVAVMIVIFIYDLRWYIIPDIVTLPVAGFFIVVNLLLGFSWHLLLICAIIGSSFFLIQFLVSGGKWMGGGDIRLGLLMGLALADIATLLFAIMLAYLVGSVVGLALIAVGRKKWGSKIPLGVFLTSSTIFSIFFANYFVSWYLSLVMI